MDILLEFILSFKWLSLVVLFFGVKYINRLVRCLERNINFKYDNLIHTAQYSEETIVGHLDYIINEVINEYTLLNIAPKEVYYINTNIQNEMLEYLKEQVPVRISILLLRQLELIYNEEYLAEYLSMHMYLLLVDFVVNYNTENYVNNT